MNDDTAGFRMDVDTMEEFFRRCAARKAKTRNERMAVLKELVYELRAIKLTGQDVVRHLKGAKLVRVKKSPHNPRDEHRCHDCGPKESL